MDFPNLPYYLDGDVKISESHTILRYIAQKHNPEMLGTLIPNYDINHLNKSNRLNKSNLQIKYK